MGKTNFSSSRATRVVNSLRNAKGCRTIENYSADR